MSDSHGFLRRMKADITGIVIYVVMMSLYGNGMLWWGIDGPWLLLVFLLALWPSIKARRYVLGEVDT